MPRSLGIDAVFFGDCALNAQELRLEAQAAATDGLSSLLAGAARWVRLSQPAEGADRAVLRELAAGVAGPVLWAFVCWVLLTARREGLRRIWFTARDGQVMLRMARRIAPRLGIDIEMGYLYGGRQVVHLAALQRFDEASLKWMTGGAGVVSTAALLERVGLVPADVQDALLRHGLPAQGAIGWGRARAVDALFRDPQVQAAVLAVAARRHEDMHGYFGACGLVDGEPCAIVDIGWRGSVLRSMFELIGPEHAARHRFLYFGLLGRPADLAAGPHERLLLRRQLHAGARRRAGRALADRRDGDLLPGRPSAGAARRAPRRRACAAACAPPLRRRRRCGTCRSSSSAWRPLPTRCRSNSRPTPAPTCVRCASSCCAR